MRRSFLAVIIAVLSAFLLNLVISNLAAPWLRNENFRSTYGEIIIFLSGIIAGRIAKNRGWLHGLITGALPYLLILLIFALAGIYFRFVLHAIWTGGNPTDVWNVGVKPLVQWIIVGGLLGSFGGIIGEKIHHFGHR